MTIFDLVEYNWYRDEECHTFFRKKEDAEAEMAERKYGYLAKDVDMRIVHESSERVSLGFEDWDGQLDIYTVLCIKEKPVH